MTPSDNNASWIRRWFMRRQGFTLWCVFIVWWIVCVTLAAFWAIGVVRLIW